MVVSRIDKLARGFTVKGPGIPGNAAANSSLHDKVNALEISVRVGSIGETSKALCVDRNLLPRRAKRQIQLFNSTMTREKT